MSKPLHVLILFSDTGGGHRSAAEALIEAWQADYPGRVQADMVDFFDRYAPFPINRAGPAYPMTIRYFSALYALVFHGSDTPQRTRALLRAFYPYTRPTIGRMLAQHPADIIVSVHPLANHIVNWTMRSMGLSRPYVTVVTDLLTAHAAWYYPYVQRIIVPTPGALARGAQYGVPPERLVVHGLPVARKFAVSARVSPRAEVRAALGLAPDRRTVLLMGGGEGMGPLNETARAIDEALAADGVNAQLVIIAGRNAGLRAELQALDWHCPTHIEGFVTNVPEWMAASDVLVTKAGPGSIVEGLISGLPLILMSRIAGQEDGNVEYVVRERVGVWEPVPELVARRLRAWLQPGNPALPDMSVRARALVSPRAAVDIAGEVLAIGEKEGVRA